MCTRIYTPIPSVQLMGTGYVTSFYNFGKKGYLGNSGRYVNNRTIESTQSHEK